MVQYFVKHNLKKNEKHQFISNKECILKSHTMSSDTSVQTNFHRKAILYNTKEYTSEKNITTVTSAQNNFQRRAIIQDIKDYTLEKSLSFQCYIRPKQFVTSATFHNTKEYTLEKSLSSVTSVQNDCHPRGVLYN